MVELNRNKKIDPQDQKQDIRNLSLDELVLYCEVINEEKFRATQIFEWIYQKGIVCFDEMSNLPKGLREVLKEKFTFSNLRLDKRETASDHTVKLVFELYDHQKIETVLIPTPQRMTVCVSVQAGCKYSCQFCASGIGGWKRNLSCAEILQQILFVKKVCGRRKLTHVVFMGVGEPLDNYREVLMAIRIINSQKALHMAARRITISTCGLVPQIGKLAEEKIQVELSVSLHGFNEESRSKLMPVNKKYPLRDLIRACREYIKRTNRQVTFEYILIQGVTCRYEAAKELGKLLGGMNCKLNLVPYNPVKEFSHQCPSKMEVLLFKKQLTTEGLHVTIRASRGRDTHAACGQLRHA